MHLIDEVYQTTRPSLCFIYTSLHLYFMDTPIHTSILQKLPMIFLVPVTFSSAEPRHKTEPPRKIHSPAAVLFSDPLPGQASSIGIITDAA